MKPLFIFLMILPLLAACGEQKNVTVVQAKQQQPLQHKIVQKHAVQAVHKRTLRHNSVQLRQYHGHTHPQVHHHGHHNETIVVVAPPHRQALAPKSNVHGHPSNDANVHAHLSPDIQVNVHQHGHNEGSENPIHEHD